jgi:hypothetical protein
MVAGQTRGVDERLVIGALRRRFAVVLVCSEARRLPDRRAAASDYLAFVARPRGDRAVDYGRFHLAGLPAANPVRCCLVISSPARLGHRPWNDRLVLRFRL